MGDSLPSPPAAVRAMRDSFGDRKLPDISRKITACVACRKQKVKCNMRDGQAPCSRCKKRGLSCTVNRSLQMLLEDDAAWKETMTQKVQRLEESMEQVAARLELPALQSQRRAHPVPMTSPSVPLGTIDDTRTASSSSSQQPPQRWQIVLDPQGGPASIPASCVSEIRTTATSGNMPASQYSDLITMGVLSLQQALSLFDIYHLRLDHFLYKVLGDLTSLDSIRKRSSLLTAAVCTVGALHSQSLGHLYDICYREYKNLVTTNTFSTTLNVDDIRGLCIGAFWLHELSWALIGTAVRVSSDIKLHHGIYRALNGDREGYLQARLYYLVYVCDHHFSIAYGRPPMSREKFIVDSASPFLETEHATEDDARLVSQVKEWSILGQVFDTCGVDVETPVPLGYLLQLRRYSIELDIWYADWNETFMPNRNVGNYPQKGVGMHWNFAKLYLCSHAFRGVPAAQERGHLAPELEEIANTGVLSAMSILNVIISDDEMRSYLHGLPLYFDTMIAFAVVFLLKVATKYGNTIRIDTDKIILLVNQTVAALNEITQYMHPQHLLVAIAEGLQKLLWKCQEQAHITQQPVQQHATTFEHSSTDIAWMENIANFDFLTNVPNVNDWAFHYPIPNGAHTDQFHPMIPH
ncbi:conserved hypothetical protein [Talaromyces stipitatus ATCC 10500]|uniref:Zn(2)-C6 fungal-type domain-containing protein n=1 Tax=Talaromyces stipitatus (strain ATCC 10500 / CBS 375.48 / QM 6759 / NRRL 1006) TaxID=441959 RepID=B8MDJ1_TALSN|nr:uncharacterized protein TSTA_117390 [Talaromyces stipitatus ATCC 10500]EED17954.1 conserved hypothetical protein [Talaromyces stipitatus ATCC 10500]